MTGEDRNGQGSRGGARRSRLLEAVIVIGVLGAFLTFVAPTLRQPLLERHDFRQTQTAYTARIFHEEGIDLAHPKLPVLGEPFEIPFEFPLFQAGASIVMDLGFADDTAMRVTGLSCFLATALLLFGLVRHVAGRAAAVAALVAFTLTPFALLWSRTSMIEYLATAGAVGFTWALIAWRENRRPLIGGLALVAGLIGTLVKPTTAIFWILPALAYRPDKRRSDGEGSRHGIWTAVFVFAPIIAGVAWTRHADSIKASSPATEWLTSRALREWNFGTFEQRFNLIGWHEIGDRVAFTIVGLLALFLPAAILALWRAPQRLFWLAIASAAVLPPLVFTNLYFQHDYYLAAVTPAIAALIGLGAGYVWDHLPRWPLVHAAAVVVALLIVWGSIEKGRWYWQRIRGGEDNSQVLSLAKELESRTRPDELVAIEGLDWSPAVLYYARRWGHMVPPANRDFAYELIHDTGYRHLLVADPQTADLGFLSRWKRVGALGPHLYSIADSAAELPSAQIVATDAGPAVMNTLMSGATLTENQRLPCGIPVRIPSGKRGTWIRLARAAPSARLAVSDALAPVPALSLVFVARQLAERGRLTITCAGAPSLDIAEVVDAGRLRARP